MRAKPGATVLIAALSLLGCGSDKMERGLVVDREEAVPEDVRELEMTEAERQRQLEAEDEKRENEAFDRAQGQ